MKLDRPVVIEHQSAIIIHGNCTIGDDCIIHQSVTLGNRYLDNPLESPQLGDRVNVGAGAKILGVHLRGDTKRQFRILLVTLKTSGTKKHGFLAFRRL